MPCGHWPPQVGQNRDEEPTIPHLVEPPHHLCPSAADALTSRRTALLTVCQHHDLKHDSLRGLHSSVPVDIDCHGQLEVEQ